MGKSGLDTPPTQSASADEPQHFALTVNIFAFPPSAHIGYALDALQTDRVPGVIRVQKKLVRQMNKARD